MKIQSLVMAGVVAVSALFSVTAQANPNQHHQSQAKKQQVEVKKEMKKPVAKKQAQKTQAKKVAKKPVAKKQVNKQAPKAMQR